MSAQPTARRFAVVARHLERSRGCPTRADGFGSCTSTSTSSSPASATSASAASCASFSTSGSHTAKPSVDDHADALARATRRPRRPTARVLVRARRTRQRRRVDDGRTRDRVDVARRVAHRAAHRAGHRHQRVVERPASPTRPNETLNPNSPEYDDGMRIDPPPSLPVQIGIMPDGDRGRRTARRTAGRALGVPRVAGDAVQVRAGPVRRAELGRRREPDEHRARAPQPRRFGAVARRDLVVRTSSDACVSGQPATCASSLTPIGTPAHGPGPRRATRVVDLARVRAARRLVDEAERVQLRVEALDASEEEVEQFLSRAARPPERLRRAPTRRVPRSPSSTDLVDLRNRYGLGRAEDRDPRVDHRARAGARARRAPRPARRQLRQRFADMAGRRRRRSPSNGGCIPVAGYAARAALALRRVGGGRRRASAGADPHAPCASATRPGRSPALGWTRVLRGLRRRARAATARDAGHEPSAARPTGVGLVDHESIGDAWEAGERQGLDRRPAARTAHAAERARRVQARRRARVGCGAGRTRRRGASPSIAANARSSPAVRAGERPRQRVAREEADRARLERMAAAARRRSSGSGTPASTSATRAKPRRRPSSTAMSDCDLAPRCRSPRTPP